MLAANGDVGEVLNVLNSVPSNPTNAIGTTMQRSMGYIGLYDYTTHTLQNVSEDKLFWARQAIKIVWKSATEFGCQLQELPKVYMVVCWFRPVLITDAQSYADNLLPPVTDPLALAACNPSPAPPTPSPPTPAPPTSTPAAPAVQYEPFAWVSLGVKLHGPLLPSNPDELPAYALNLADNLRRAWDPVPPYPFSIAVMSICDLKPNGKKPFGLDANTMCHAVNPFWSNTTARYANVLGTTDEDSGIFAEVLLRDASQADYQKNSEVLHYRITQAANREGPLSDPGNPTRDVNPMPFASKLYLAQVQEGEAGSDWHYSVSRFWTEDSTPQPSPEAESEESVALWAWLVAACVAIAACGGIISLLAVKRAPPEKGAVSVSDFYKAMPAPQDGPFIPEEHYCMDEVASSVSSVSHRDMGYTGQTILPMGRI